jgi:chromosomal replication initiation ATPase DnaA
MLIENFDFHLEHISSDLSEADQALFEKLVSAVTSRTDRVQFSQTLRSELETFFRWAAQFAKLTRGYVPGDLWSVLQRAYFLYSATTSLVSSESVGDQKRVLNWNTLSQALLSTPLKLTADLDFSSQSDQSSKPSKLNWDSFIASSEFKLHLQRLLSVFSGERQNEVPPGFAQVKLPKGFVIHGPSGCGKTLLSNIICKEVR